MPEDAPNHPPTTRHNYFAKVLALGLRLEPGDLGDVDVRHDDWCDIHRRGFCNCDPDVSLRPKLN